MEPRQHAHNCTIVPPSPPLPEPHAETRSIPGTWVPTDHFQVPKCKHKSGQTEGALPRGLQPLPTIAPQSPSPPSLSCDERLHRQVSISGWSFGYIQCACIWRAKRAGMSTRSRASNSSFAIGPKRQAFYKPWPGHWEEGLWEGCGGGRTIVRMVQDVPFSGYISSLRVNLTPFPP